MTLYRSPPKPDWLDHLLYAGSARPCRLPWEATGWLPASPALQRRGLYSEIFA